MDNNYYKIENFEEVGKIILFHRKKSGLTRNELSKLSGVGQSSIYELERGKLTVGVSILIKVLKILNINIFLYSPLISFYNKQNQEK